MQKIGFTEALDQITAQNSRYARDAYIFLRDALDFTIKRKKNKEGGMRHVSGPELLEGARLFAISEYGPMAVTVLNYWGVKRTIDFGHMVFNLIESGVFGKTDTDSLEDFRDGYDFHAAFVQPYLPIAEAALEEPAAEDKARGTVA